MALFHSFPSTTILGPPSLYNLFGFIPEKDFQWPFIFTSYDITGYGELSFSQEKTLEIPVHALDTVQISHLINTNYKQSSTLWAH